jgi:hypothetical protein
MFQKKQFAGSRKAGFGGKFGAHDEKNLSAQ